MKKKIAVVIACKLALAVTVTAQVKPAVESVPAAQTVATKPTAYSPGIPLNYIRTWEPARPFTTEADVIASSRVVKEVSRSTEYMDGLGRPLQKVGWKASPLNNAGVSFDIVAPVVYDELGREEFKYNPYTATTGNGIFKTTPFSEQEAFMLALYPGEQVYYSRTEYEASPLSRVLKTMAPGNSWAGCGRGVQTSYEVNAASEVRVWTIGFTAGEVPSSPGYYAAGELFRTVTADEHGKRVVEYKDKSELVVLKKVEVVSGAAVTGISGWLCTYYVYDDLNQLRYLIQPKGTEALSTTWSFNAATWSASNIAKELCFSYEYDERGRMIVKRVPGAGETQMVYDARDRLVMTQDARQKLAQQWVVTHYDHLNRAAKTYLWTSAATRATHAAAAAGSADYPGISSPADGYLTINFYDNYDWVSGSGSGLSAAFASGETTSGFMAASDVTFPYARNIVPETAVKGLLTGTQVRVLGTTQYLYSVNFYDDHSRLIQIKSTNISGATDIVTNQYNFNGKVLMTKISHAATGMTPGTIKVMMQQDYDHAGRLLTVKKQINNGAWVTVSSISYDAAGQVAAKQLGQQKPGGVYNTTPIETLTYNFNIRGWLTGINKNYVANPGGVSNYFGEALSYDYGFTQKQYNGEIAGVTWCSRNDQQVRSYGYTYDAASRLLKADFTEKINATTWNTSLGRDYTTVMGNGVDPVQAYDANGNILRMQHYITPASRIDDLSYSYDLSATAGNRLKRVTDAYNNNASTLGDFKEITGGQTQDYDYDTNGNLVYDLNKGISSITYNYQNLPSVITVTGKGSIAYTYDALGNKLKKTVTDATNGNTVTTSAYIGCFQYENNDLKQFLHEEGRVRRKPDGSYVYDYFVKDHLGNVRATLTEEETVTVYQVATMEVENAQTEETYYSNVAETRALKPSAYPDRDTANRYVAKLDGKKKKLGPSLLLKVSAGDKINIRVKSWYKHNREKNENMPLSESASELLGSSSGVSVLHDASALAGTPGASAIVPGIMSFLQARDAEDEKISRKPRAYLNWVLLDEDLNPIKDDSVGGELRRHEYKGFQRVGEEGALTQHVKEGWEVEKSGYVYIFTSNESADAEVVFEELGITSVQGPLLEVDHFYPFGLAIAGICSRAEGKLRNRNKYNGKELQDGEFSDGTGLNEYDYGARFYDPQIGRWGQVDPLARSMPRWSVYAYAFNNPIRFLDKDGRAPGELYKSADAAAIAWAIQYGEMSILNGVEYSSMIYSWTVGGETYYSYTAAESFNNKSFNYYSSPGPDRIQIPKGATARAHIHSHGNWDADTDNDFSKSGGMLGPKDEDLMTHNPNLDFYLTAPNGTLRVNRNSDPSDNSGSIVIVDGLPRDRAKYGPYINPKEHGYNGVAFPYYDRLIGAKNLGDLLVVKEKKKLPGRSDLPPHPHSNNRHERSVHHPGFSKAF